MQDPNFSAPRPFDRPSARPSAMPVQRGNYGLPPRRPAPIAPAPASTPQPAPQTVTPPMPTPPRSTAGPRMMDVVAPSRPIQSPSAPVVEAAVKPVTPSAPESTGAVEAALETRQPPRQPIFSSKPTPIEEVTPHKERHLLPKLRLALLVVGAVLVLAGAARWATAGSTSGHIIAVGAVSANNGESMTIQFTADDGQLHKFTDTSDEKLIPGTSLQVAYRSGAADNSVKRIAPIESAKQLGTSMAIGGIALLAFGGAATLVMRRQPKHSNIALAQPVTASV